MLRLAFNPSRTFTAALLLSGCMSLAAVAAEPAPSRVVPLAEITLPDSADQAHALSSLAGERGLLVVLIGTECPLVRAYMPRLIALHRGLRERGFGLVAVDANPQDSPAEVAAFSRELSLPFTVLLDRDQQLAGILAATRTPEVCLLDAQGMVRYRGQIDDQYGLGFQRAEPRQHYLEQALADLTAGRAVATPVTEPVGCLIGRLQREPDPKAGGGEVTYTNQIVRLLAKNCAGCHRDGDIAPFALTNYESAAAWADTCVEAVDAGRMPPWFASPEYGKFSNEHRLLDEEKSLLRRWVAAGCPEGARDQLPAPDELVVVEEETFVPDAVYPMSHVPFDVPAGGTVDYQYYAIDPGWTEDKWITRSEIYAGQRSVVHHVLLFVQRAGVHYPSIYPGELIGGFVPGRRGETLPDGVAFHIPAGSRIVFQMHYTPNGVPKTDMTHVGFKFADPATVQYVASARRAINVMFQIPPRDANYQAGARYEFRRPAVLLSLTPHMHVRGKSFRYDAIYPDGRRQTLLEVPRWDFNWQMDYALAEPLAISAGTVLECTAVYDNSEQNPANPDPSQWVTFGEQTWQEMLIGFFVVAEPIDQHEGSADQIAAAVGELVQRARSLPAGESKVDRAVALTRGSIDFLRSAGDMAHIRQTRELSEIEHVIAGALVEAQKQKILGPGRDPANRDGRGLSFLLKSTQVLRELTAENKLRVTKVEPVAWPLTATDAAPSPSE